MYNPEETRDSMISHQATTRPWGPCTSVVVGEWRRGRKCHTTGRLSLRSLGPPVLQPSESRMQMHSSDSAYVVLLNLSLAPCPCWPTAAADDNQFPRPLNHLGPPTRTKDAFPTPRLLRDVFRAVVPREPLGHFALLPSLSASALLASLLSTGLLLEVRLRDHGTLRERRSCLDT